VSWDSGANSHHCLCTKVGGKRWKDMRLVTIFGFLIFIGCRGQSSKNKDFTELRDKLPTIITPLKLPRGFRTLSVVDLPENGILKSIKGKMEKRHLPFPVYGKIFDTEEYISILGVIPTSAGTPVMFVFDNQGNQIDSLVIYHDSSGYVADFTGASQTYNYGQILHDRQIISVDSLVEWDVDIIQGVPFANEKSQRQSTVKRKYRILDNGRIEQVE
jgi:hypothetical protein